MLARRNAFSVAAIALLLSTVQCAENPITGSEATLPASLDIVGGDGQSGFVGTELPEPLAVLALDGKDKPVEGALVNFVVTQGGGQVFAGSCLTNKDGECRERWTLGTTAGEQAVEARAVNPATGAKIVYATFTALALPGPVAALEKISGDGQSAQVGTELPDPLVVRAVDQYGNGVPEVEVTWSVVSGGGSISPEVALTGETGEASGLWTLGSEVGEQTAKASTAEAADAVFTATATAPPPPTWAGGLAGLPTAVRAAAAASDGSRIYVLGGATGFAGCSTLNQIYDPATDTWSTGANFAGPGLANQMVAAMADGIHVLGGAACAPPALTRHQVYDPASDTWSDRAPLPEPKTAQVAKVVGGKLYVIGPVESGASRLYVYDPATNSWSQATPMPTLRGETAGGVIDGKIYVAGGACCGGTVTYDVLERYDPATDSWETLAPMPAPRSALGGGVIGGQFCVFGGRLANPSPTGDAFPDTFCYDPATDSWSSGPDMITPRVEPASTEHDGAVYAIGGRTPSSFAVSANERLK